MIMLFDKIRNGIKHPQQYSCGWSNKETMIHDINIAMLCIPARQLQWQPYMAIEDVIKLRRSAK